jgi:hypothetical protein
VGRQKTLSARRFHTGSLNWCRCDAVWPMIVLATASRSQNSVSDFSRDPNRPSENGKRLCFDLLRYQKAVVVVMLHEEGSLPVQVPVYTQHQLKKEHSRAKRYLGDPCRATTTRTKPGPETSFMIYISFHRPLSITSKNFLPSNTEHRNEMRVGMILILKEVAGKTSLIPFLLPRKARTPSDRRQPPNLIFYNQSPAVNYRVVGVPAPA